MTRWPNLFLVGAAKAGTSSLHSHLTAFPSVFMSESKEPHFFSAEQVAHLRYPGALSDEAAYLKLFSSAPETALYLGESSTSYLPCVEAANKIHDHVPGARIIISLRDPVDRVFSHYLMEKEAGSIRTPFLIQSQRELAAERLGPLHIATYADAVRRYQTLFGQERVLVLFFEEWTQNPSETIIEVARFLDLPAPAATARHHKVYNPFRKRTGLGQLLRQSDSLVRAVRNYVPLELRRTVAKHILARQVPKPQIDAQSEEVLTTYYRHDVDELARLLRRPTPWSRFAK